MTKPGRQTRIPLGRCVAAAALLGLAAGCATRGPSTTGPIFYPPAPDAPRLQFLRSFATSDDLRPQSRFGAFIVGRIRPTPIAKPYGVATYSGRIFVCDTGMGLISVLDLHTKRMHSFVPQGAAQLITPINITIDQDGTRYVSDTGRGQVLIFGPAEEYLGAIGVRIPPRVKTTDAPAENEIPPTPTAEKSTNTVAEMRPTDVAVSSNRLFVADTKGHCVRVFDKASRTQLFAIPRDATNMQTRLFQPTNLALDGRGHLYVSDTGGFRVQEYDTEGVFVRSFGQQGLRPGDLALPKGVAVDREGRLYIVDAKTQVAQIFDAEGQLLMFFGEPNASAAPLNLPAKVTIDYDDVDLFRQYAVPGFQLEYLVIITNQYGARKVSVYGFGHQL